MGSNYTRLNEATTGTAEKELEKLLIENNPKPVKDETTGYKCALGAACIFVASAIPSIPLGVVGGLMMFYGLLPRRAYRDIYDAF